MKTQQHWEQVYATKSQNEVSWTQQVPEQSLSIIDGINVPQNSPIIDIGGGDSLLVDFLLDEGYTDLTVLDISAVAIDRAKNRLGLRADQVNWIVSDILDFEPDRDYAIWHDRATFHFLTESWQVKQYLKIVKKSIKKGHLIVGAFSENGPKGAAAFRSSGTMSVRCLTYLKMDLL
jgi:trans-aconitate methyltransferase